MNSLALTHFLITTSRLTTSLFQRFAVIGVSGGGPYALACAARIPERVSGVSLVAALGPIGTAEGLRDGMTGLNRRVLALAAHRPSLARLGVRLATPWVRRHLSRYLDHMASRAPLADRRVFADPSYRQVFVASTREALRQGGAGVAWELSLLAGAWDFSLHEIRLPVRIWHGLTDNIVPVEMARHMAACLPCSQIRFLEHEGHISLIVKHLDAALAESFP